MGKLTPLQKGAAVAGIIGASVAVFQWASAPPHPAQHPATSSTVTGDIKATTGGVAIGSTGSINITAPPPPNQSETRTVDGSEVSVTADWNDRKEGTGAYTAPRGWKILQLVVHEISNANGGTYRTEISGDQARVIVSAHGSGKFYDQYRGWVHVKSSIILERA